MSGNSRKRMIMQAVNLLLTAVSAIKGDATT